MECRGGLVSKSCLTLVIPWTVAHQAPKKNETAPFSATWIDLDRDYYTNWNSQRKKNRWYHLSSVGKESACNAGNPSSIPWSGRSAGEGIGYPLQCSWASLVAQLVKNPPATRETWVWSQGWEDPLEKGKVTHSSILAQRITYTVQSIGSQRLGHNWATFTFTLIYCLLLYV